MDDASFERADLPDGKGDGVSLSVSTSHPGEIEYTKLTDLNGVPKIEPDDISQLRVTQFGDYSVIFVTPLPDPKVSKQKEITSRTFIPRRNDQTTLTFRDEEYPVVPVAVEIHLDKRYDAQSGHFWQVALDESHIVDLEGHRIDQLVQVRSWNDIQGNIAFVRSQIADHSFNCGVRPRVFIAYAHHGLELMYTVDSPESVLQGFSPILFSLYAQSMKNSDYISNPDLFRSAREDIDLDIARIDQSIADVSNIQLEKEIDEDKLKSAVANRERIVRYFNTITILKINKVLHDANIPLIETWKDIASLSRDTWKLIEQYEAKGQANRTVATLLSNFGYLAHGKVDHPEGSSSYSGDTDNPLRHAWIYAIAQKVQETYKTDPKGNLSQMVGELKKGIDAHIDSLEKNDKNRDFYTRLASEISGIFSHISFEESECIFEN